MTQPERLIYIHIPKTAGTSLRNAIESRYHKDKIAPYENIIELSTTIADHYYFYRGHFGYKDISPYIPKSYFISVLRDPVERVLSLYSFWRNIKNYHGTEENDPNYKGVMLAKNDCLSNFIRTKEKSILKEISNTQLRYLMHGLNADIKHHDIIDIKQQVKKIAKNYLWIGFVDSLEEDFVLLKKILDLDIERLPHKNKGLNFERQVNKKDIEYIKTINNLDIILYNELKKYKQTQS